MSRLWAYKASDRIDQLPLNMQLLVKEVKAAVDKEPLELIKHMKRYLEINSNSMRKHYGIGWVYFNTEQWKEAIKAFEKTIEISSRYEIKTWAWTYILLGRAYHKISEHKKEKKIFNNALDLFPDEESQFTYWQAVCSLSLRDTIEANKYLEKFIGIGKQNGWPESETLSLMAGIYNEADNLIRAEELYRKALSINRDNTKLLNNLAYFLISNDINIDEGLELISRALKKIPDDGNYLHTYGLGLSKQGKLTEALETLNMAWALIPYYDHDHFLHIQEVEKALASQN
jgi:tetratricopeptide (TPR) repeat protein